MERSKAIKIARLGGRLLFLLSMSITSLPTALAADCPGCRAYRDSHRDDLSKVGYYEDSCYFQGYEQEGSTTADAEEPSYTFDEELAPQNSLTNDR